jgi:acetoin utilization deacetylase AcuC-like enzyme
VDIKNSAMIPVIYSDEFLDHDTSYFGGFHPECAGRLTAIVKALKTVSWHDRIDWQIPTPVASRKVLPWIEKIHTPEHIQRVSLLAKRGGGNLDEDTPVSPRSYDVALLAVSAWLDGVDKVLTSNNPAFVLARPPGHHATSSQGMGFCLFSNAAIAANYALAQPGVNRVAILDWDVHHGNGTEAIVQSNPQIIYCSLHQFPCYPGTGRASDRGMHDNVLNLPMRPGSTFADYEPVFVNQVIPFLRNFQPDLLIISAGYDANHDDPLAGMSLQPKDYGIFTAQCLQVTRRILFGLEGGYDFNSLSQSVVATIERCLD